MPMQQVIVENPLTQLDFLFVIAGCLEFVLEDTIQRQMRNDQRNVFKLRAKQHIDSQDIITEQEQIPTSEAEQHRCFSQSSEVASANRLVRRATLKNMPGLPNQTPRLDAQLSLTSPADAKKNTFATFRDKETDMQASFTSAREQSDVKMVKNPFFFKRIKTIIATQKSIVLRLPFRITDQLGLSFQNFNPRACHWVDKTYAEMLFDIFPDSFKRKHQKIRDELLNVFRVKVLESPTLL